MKWPMTLLFLEIAVAMLLVMGVWYWVMQVHALVRDVQERLEALEKSGLQNGLRDGLMRHQLRRP